ncbi:hypothetical protein EXIGLDRAFT_708888 [Exidia glandulosa HHB12029]|uniref:Uncharacterized protein n=1 Tax=Exidia glandulosa HHB12029 TaxID=1314781 RepID=A0A166AR08_EXIGL|nr:hypothetical protein EXIGLDRAFT_708888 [Exidia glandulosa HHB12029]
MLALVAVLLLALATWTTAQLVNVTIDDTTGDKRTGVMPVYTVDPNSTMGGWGWSGSCPGCISHPDIALVHGGTWHSDTAWVGDGPSNVTMSFNGVAVYVFGVLKDDDKALPVNLRFFIDSKLVGSYEHQPVPAKDAYTYNVPLFSAISLEEKEHNFVISNTQTGHPSTLFFDYVLYTTFQPSTTAGTATPHNSQESNTSQPGSNQVGTGVIIGSILGAFALLILAISVLLSRYHCRRRPRMNAPPCVEAPAVPALTPHVSHTHAYASHGAGLRHSARVDKMAASLPTGMYYLPPPYEVHTAAPVSV